MHKLVPRAGGDRKLESRCAEGCDENDNEERGIGR